MLNLYRRHLKSCGQTSARYKRCQCPIWVIGTLGGTSIRRSLDLTSWDAAQRVLGRWVTAGQIGQVTEVGETLEDVVTAFLADAHTRGLSAATITKYRVLLTNRLVAWSHSSGLEMLTSIDLDALTKFRTTWPDAPLAKSKNTERLKAFFRWCVARGWLTTSPAEGLGTIKVPHDPTLPFTTDEVSSILSAVDTYPTFNQYGYDNRARVRAFVLVLRWTGLRIRDVVTLSWDQVKDGKVRLYTQKTGQHVHIPLPETVVAALERIRTDKKYIFWTGNGSPKSAVADWQRTLRRLFALTTVTGAHAHRFRDTFAVELLLAGVDMTDVSVLLGHSSIKVTEKHYAAWVATRQRRLESIVQKTWQTPETVSLAPVPASAPVPQPTPESASTARETARPTRTGTDDGPTRARHSTLRLVPSPNSEAR